MKSPNTAVAAPRAATIAHRRRRSARRPRHAGQALSIRYLLRRAFDDAMDHAIAWLATLRRPSTSVTGIKDDAAAPSLAAGVSNAPASERSK